MRRSSGLHPADLAAAGGVPLKHPVPLSKPSPGLHPRPSPEPRPGQPAGAQWQPDQPPSLLERCRRGGGCRSGGRGAQVCGRAGAVRSSWPVTSPTKAGNGQQPHLSKRLAASRAAPDVAKHTSTAAMPPCAGVKTRVWVTVPTLSNRLENSMQVVEASVSPVTCAGQGNEQCWQATAGAGSGRYGGGACGRRFRQQSRVVALQGQRHAVQVHKNAGPTQRSGAARPRLKSAADSLTRTADAMADCQ